MENPKFNIGQTVFYVINNEWNTTIFSGVIEFIDVCYDKLEKIYKYKYGIRLKNQGLFEHNEERVFEKLEDVLVKAKEQVQK